MSTPRGGTFREDAAERYYEKLVESQQCMITTLGQIIDDQAARLKSKTTKLRDAKLKIAELEGLNRPQQPLIDELKAKISGLVKEVEKLTKEKADQEARRLQQSQSNSAQFKVSSGGGFGLGLGPGQAPVSKASPGGLLGQAPVSVPVPVA